MRKPYFAFVLFLLLQSLSAQQIFTDGFSDGDIKNWTIISDRTLVDVQNESLWIHTEVNEDYTGPTILLPAVGAVSDFTLKVFGPPGELEGVALFRGDANHYIAAYIESDTMRVAYKPLADSSESVLYSAILPDSLDYRGMWEFAVSGEAPSFHVEMYFNDSLNYSGDITDAEEYLNFGQVGIYFWGTPLDVTIDSVYLAYEPYLTDIVNYRENFDNNNAPGWFIENSEGLTEFVDGALHLAYSQDHGVDDKYVNTLYFIPPLPPMSDGWFESSATGEIGDGAIYLARVNGEHYIVAVIAHDSIYLGYNDKFSDDNEPMIIASDSLAVPEREWHLFRMEFENTDSSVIVTATLDSLINLSGEIINPSDALRSGSLLGAIWSYDVDWYMNDFAAYFETVTEVKTEEAIAPKEFLLYQNYPNPFNPSTKIKYSVPVSLKGDYSFVNLTVYDALGRKVRTLVNEEKSPGIYTVDFNASDLSSGMYFYKIIIGNGMSNFTDIRKAMLIK